MRASVLVGRVGGLAVALGIGSGMAVGGVGAAWANPADSASGAGAASASDPASTRTTPVSRRCVSVADGRPTPQRNLPRLPHHRPGTPIWLRSPRQTH